MVQANFDRWESLVGRTNVHIVEGDELASHIDELGLSDRGLTIQAKSNLLRVQLLQERGGAWFDATVLPMPGVAAWTRQRVENAPFFAFRRGRAGTVLGSWFLVATPGLELTEAWLQNMCAYWDRDRVPAGKSLLRPLQRRWRHRVRANPVWAVTPGAGAASRFRPYHWMHYAFEYTVATNPTAAHQWEAGDRLSTLPPHLIKRLRESTDDSEFLELYPSLFTHSPVHKLCWRLHWPEAFIEDIRSQTFEECA
ncbi:capsular polysaccharide synthesis protein [Rhodobacteraceae bacterium M385]|nr:capsular polysaccharide synthesis protein [Rhodobacteraceae bacterium M385]